MTKSKHRLPPRRRQHELQSLPGRATDPSITTSLPRFLRFRDIRDSRLINNWQTLARLIAEQGFPPGTLIGANTRVWTQTEIEAWLATRPTAAKALPHIEEARRQRKADAEHPTPATGENDHG